MRIQRSDVAPAGLGQPRRWIRKAVALTAGTVLAAASGCGQDRAAQEYLRPIVSPAIPATTQEIVNPLRGQYEDLLQPLFPQGNSADKRYPAWPKANDASLRVTWRQLQPTDPHTVAPNAPDDHKYDFSAIDDALAKTAGRGMRLILQVLSYNSCCNAFYPANTNVEIPDWLRAIPGSSTSYPGPSAKSTAPSITQVVPNWNDPNYLSGFEQLLAALGRRYDRDERLSIFEFSGYGDFSENHISYVRDALGAPGPTPQDSVAALGYYSVFRDQTITVAAIRQLVWAHISSFPHTQLDVTLNNPEIVRELLSDNVTKLLDSPVGLRTNALGFYSPMPAWATNPNSAYVTGKDPLIAEIRKRFASVPFVTEWADLTGGRERDLPGYYEQALRDVVKYHVSMTSSVNFPDSGSNTMMAPNLYVLWAEANAIAGYRYSVEAQSGSQSQRDGTAAIAVRWTNYGSAAATEKWVPGYRLVDFSGSVVRNMPSSVVLKKLLHEEAEDGTDSLPVPISADETVHVDLAGLPPGHYTLQAAAGWQQHKPGATHVVDYPPMHLARDGRDGSGWYPIATLDLPLSHLASESAQ